MLTFALLRNSSDLHIYKDLYGERNKPGKKRKITVIFRFFPGEIYMAQDTVSSNCQLL